MPGLADRWFNIATLNTDQRLKLFEDTENVAHYLDQMQGNTAPTVQEKVAEVTGSLLKAFNSHSVGEATEIAHYMMSSNPDADQHLHHLFTAIQAATGKTADSPDLYQMAYIDSASTTLEFDLRKKNLFVEMGQIDRGLSEKVNLGLRDLLAMRDVSEENRKAANLILIQKLNNDEISYEDLKLTTVGDVVKFFGEQCNEIRFLKVSDKLFTKTQSQDVYELSGKNLVQKLSRQFPNLEALYISIDLKTPNIRITDLEIPRLKSLEIYSKQESTLDLKFVEKLPHLEIFRCSQNRVENYASFGKCPNLRFLKMSGGNVSTLDFLENCPKIEFLDATCFKNTNLAVLEGLENLTHIYLSTKNGGICKGPYQEELNLLKQTNLRQILLEDFPIVTLNVGGDLSAVSLESMSKLQNVNLKNCIRLQLIDLRHCPSVKNVEMGDCNAIERITLRKCANLETTFLNKSNKHLDFMFITKCPHIKISKDTSCPVLREFVLADVDIEETLFLAHCPRLKLLELANIDNINELDIENFPRQCEIHVMGDETFNEDVADRLRQKGIKYKYSSKRFY